MLILMTLDALAASVSAVACSGGSGQQMVTQATKTEQRQTVAGTTWPQQSSDSSAVAALSGEIVAASLNTAFPLTEAMPAEFGYVQVPQEPYTVASDGHLSPLYIAN